jgi:hypothetical protein
VAIASETVTSDFAPSSAVEAMCEPGGFQDRKAPGRQNACYFGLYAANILCSTCRLSFLVTGAALIRHGLIEGSHERKHDRRHAILPLYTVGGLSTRPARNAMHPPSLNRLRISFCGRFHQHGPQDGWSGIGDRGQRRESSDHGSCLDAWRYAALSPPTRQSSDINTQQR